jgi:hypothetical protein
MFKLEVTAVLELPILEGISLLCPFSNLLTLILGVY